MKKCPNCGNEVPAGKKFCGNCGADMNPKVLKIAKEKKIGSSLTGTKKRNLIIAVISIVAILLAMFIGHSIFEKNSMAKERDVFSSEILGDNGSYYIGNHASLNIDKHNNIVIMLKTDKYDVTHTKIRIIGFKLVKKGSHYGVIPGEEISYYQDGEKGFSFKGKSQIYGSSKKSIYGTLHLKNINKSDTGKILNFSDSDLKNNNDIVKRFFASIKIEKKGDQLKMTSSAVKKTWIILGVNNFKEDN